MEIKEKVKVTLIKEPNCDLVVKVEEKYNTRNYNNLIHIESRSRYIKEIYGDEFHNKTNFYHNVIKDVLIGKYESKKDDIDTKLNNILFVTKINNLLADNKPVNLILGIKFCGLPRVPYMLNEINFDFSEEEEKEQLKKFESYFIKQF